MTGMELPPDAPPAIRTLVDRLTGGDASVSALGGMSGARVMLVRGRLGAVVVKAGAGRRERDAYRLLGPSLLRAGIGVPMLRADLDDDSGGWLVLEAVPAALPRGRWLADPDVMATLRRLHALGAGAIDVLPDPFRPAWEEGATRRALRWLPAMSDLVARLDGLRREAAPLFEPVAAISADPNPTNWRLRANGDLVLLDWERVGRGHPAIDLAISVPGLGSGTDFERVIAGYERPGGRVTPGEPLTPRLLRLAKLWTAIELLADSPVRRPDGAGAPVEPADPAVERRLEVAGALGATLPGWIESWA